MTTDPFVVLLSALLSSCSNAPHADAGVRPSLHPVTNRAADVVRDGAIEPQLRVRVTALDPVSRGATVRLVVSLTSARSLDATEVTLVSTGGTSNAGASRVVLGSLPPGQVRQALFTVVLPTTGGRQFVQFEASGEGAQGRLARGACYNLLPDGNLEVGRIVMTPQGKRVHEVRAGRID